MKTCVPGALPNFNHLVWVVECPTQLQDPDALDSSACNVATGSSCVGAAPDWYSMKVAFTSQPGWWYYVFVM